MNPETVTSEVAQIRRQLSTHRYLTLFAIALAGLPHLLSFQEPSPILRAQRLEIADPEGRNRLVLDGEVTGSSGAEAGIWLIDSKGSSRLILRTQSDEAAGLTLFDDSNAPRIILSSNPRDEGGAGISVLDGESVTRAQIATHKEAHPSGLILSNRNGTERLQIGTTADGNPFVFLLDEGGAARISADISADSLACLSVNDTKGMSRTANSCDKAGVAGSTYFDDKGVPRIGISSGSGEEAAHILLGNARAIFNDSGGQNITTIP